MASAAGNTSASGRVVQQEEQREARSGSSTLQPTAAALSGLPHTPPAADYRPPSPTVFQPIGPSAHPSTRTASRSSSQRNRIVPKPRASNGHPFVFGTTDGLHNTFDFNPLPAHNYTTSASRMSKDTMRVMHRFAKHPLSLMTDSGPAPSWTNAPLAHAPTPPTFQHEAHAPTSLYPHSSLYPATHPAPPMLEIHSAPTTWMPNTVRRSHAFVARRAAITGHHPHQAMNESGSFKFTMATRAPAAVPMGVPHEVLSLGTSEGRPLRSSSVAQEGPSSRFRDLADPETDEIVTRIILEASDAECQLDDSTTGGYSSGGSASGSGLSYTAPSGYETDSADSGYMSSSRNISLASTPSAGGGLSELEGPTRTVGYAEPHGSQTLGLGHIQDGFPSATMPAAQLSMPRMHLEGTEQYRPLFESPASVSGWVDAADLSAAQGVSNVHLLQPTNAHWGYTVAPEANQYLGSNGPTHAVHPYGPPLPSVPLNRQFPLAHLTLCRPRYHISPGACPG